MVYMLGRDVSVYITTEDPRSGGSNIDIDAAGSITIANGGAASSTAATLAAGTLSGTLDDDVTVGDAQALANLTGVDLSIGAMDEDISYFGKRSITKAEIKKETTVSLTRKKINNHWDVLFNTFRYGCSGGVELTGLEEVGIGTGYRIHVELNPSSSTAPYGDVFSVKGACIQSHTTSVNADGVQEETIEFMSYIDPSIGQAANQVAITPAIL